MTTQNPQLRFKLCKECDQPFPEKGNKFFCSRKCQNTSNNRESRRKQAPFREKNQILKNNYRILQKLIRSSIFPLQAIPKVVFEYEGFNFQVFTGFNYNRNTKITITWIYDIGIEPNQAGDTFCIWQLDSNGNII